MKEEFVELRLLLFLVEWLMIAEEKESTAGRIASLAEGILKMEWPTQS